ncbi:unnamed protein product, partial [Prorocentrum cordatum]
RGALARAGAPGGARRRPPPPRDAPGRGCAGGRAGPRVPADAEGPVGQEVPRCPTAALHRPVAARGRGGAGGGARARPARARRRHGGSHCPAGGVRGGGRWRALLDGDRGWPTRGCAGAAAGAALGPVLPPLRRRLPAARARPPGVRGGAPPPRGGVGCAGRWPGPPARGGLLRLVRGARRGRRARERAPPALRP